MHRVVRSPTLAPLHRKAGLLAVLSTVGLNACKGCHETNLVKSDEVVEEESFEFEADWGSWLSMDVTSDGNPAVAFYDKTSGALGFAIGTIEGDGTVTWSFEEVDGYVSDEGMDTGDRGLYASMAIASDGTVWIGYRDALNRNLRYATRATDGTWTSDVADTGGGSSPDAGLFASLALDGSDEPVIAHYDQGQGTLRVAHWNGSGFTGEMVDAGEDYNPDTGTGEEAADADVGQYARLRIIGGTEHIAYYDSANGDLKLATGGASAYSLETVHSEGDVGAWPDILADGSTVHIAFQDVGEQDLLYSIGSSGSWTTTVVDDGDHVGADTALYLQSSGDPAIVYFDGLNNDMMSAKSSGGSWTTDTVTGSDGARGFHNEVISAGGTTYVGCYDYTLRTLWFSALD